MKLTKMFSLLILSKVPMMGDDGSVEIFQNMKGLQIIRGFSKLFKSVYIKAIGCYTYLLLSLKILKVLK